MASSLRMLHESELAYWDKAVAESAQGTVFHSSAWNAMVAESEGTQCCYWVSEKKSKIQGGLVVRLSKSNRQIREPVLGGNGPFFSNSLEYDRPVDTYFGYQIHHELLKAILETADKVTIRNLPDLWNARPYTFHGWTVRTSFTHVVRCSEFEQAWHSLNSELASRVQHAELRLSQTTSNSEQLAYCKYLERTRTVAADTVIDQITRMKHLGYGQFVKMVSKEGSSVCQTILLFSEQNRTIYVAPVYEASQNMRDIVHLSLVRQLCVTYSKDFKCIDLGESPDMVVSQIRDQSGGQLVPYFTASYHRNQ